MGARMELTGNKFNRLLVVRQKGISRDGKVIWSCVCDCGRKVFTTSYRLTSGKTASCGCLRRELLSIKNTTHGQAFLGKKTSEYNTWMNIKYRCLKESNTRYYLYGGRGIKICKRWLSGFSNFYSDMGPKPSKKHSIDRKNTNNGYTPSNCRWVLSKVQSRNKRNNVWITYKGRKKIISDWAKLLNCSSTQIQYYTRRGKSFDWVYKKLKQ